MNHTQHNYFPTTKKIGNEYKNISTTNNFNDDNNFKINKPRESNSEAKIYINTHQNFFKPNNENNGIKSLSILNNGKRDKQILHIKPVEIVQDANERINLKIIENYHRIFLNQKKNKYTNDYLNNIFKLLKRKDNKYYEKRFLVSSYEEMKKEEEKIYLTGIQMSKKRETESKPNSQNNIKSGKKPLIQNLHIDDDKMKNIVDFNTKYMTNEANALREKLKSRQSRADSSKQFALKEEKENNLLSNNNQNNVFSKETNETDNKIFTKSYNTNFNNYHDNKNIRTASNKKKNIVNINKSDGLNESIKTGLDVELNYSGSTPDLSEILDSRNKLNLKDEEMQKLIKKNLAKQYNFKTDEEVKNQINKLFSKKSNNKNKKPNENKDINNNKINVNKKDSGIENNKNKPGFFNSNQKNNNNNNNKLKNEESPTRKNHIGDLIKFEKNSEKEKLAMYNKINNVKIKLNNMNIENDENDEENSVSSNDSLMQYVSNVYKLRQKSTERARQDKTKSKLTELDKIINNNNNFNEIINKKASLLSEFKNSNFFNKFKFFEKNNNNSNNKLKRRNHSNLRNASYDNSFINNKNVSFIKNNFNQNTNNIKNNSNGNDKIILTAKEIKQRKLDELYVKNINYDKILKNNIEIMRNLFPNKKKKIIKPLNSSTAYNGFFNVKDEVKYSSRNSVLHLESNNNTNLFNTNLTNFKNNSQCNNNTINNKENYLNSEYNQTDNSIQNKHNEKKNKVNPISIDENINLQSMNKLGNSVFNSNRKNSQNNYIEKFNNDNYKNNTIENNHISVINNKSISPTNKNSAKAIRKFSENDLFNNKKDNETITFAQSVCRILKGKNNIFDTQGGINTDFLKDLRNMKEKNLGYFSYKCYDTKNYGKFEKQLIEKINQIKK